MTRAGLSIIPGRICWHLVMWFYPTIAFNNAILSRAMHWAEFEQPETSQQAEAAR